MYDGFKARAAAVRALLSGPEAGFVLVTSPGPAAVGEALAFHGRLRAEAMPVAGLVVNRLTPDLWPSSAPLPGAGELLGALARAGSSGLPPNAGLAGRLAAALAEHQALVHGEQAALAPLLAQVGDPCVLIPRLEGEVHDLSGLARISERL